MNKIPNKYLPVGSIVIVKESTHFLMITGHAATNAEKKDKVWDYLSCPYPEGIIDENTIYVFNHEDILAVEHLGYSDDECNNYLSNIEKRINENLNN